MFFANKQSEVKLKSNLDEKLETLMSETSTVKNDHIKNMASVNINEIRTEMSSVESNNTYIIFYSPGNPIWKYEALKTRIEK